MSALESFPLPDFYQIRLDVPRLGLAPERQVYARRLLENYTKRNPISNYARQDGVLAALVTDFLFDQDQIISKLKVDEERDAFIFKYYSKLREHILPRCAFESNTMM